MARRLLERNDERHLRSTEEMVELFSDLPEATGNTGELSARLEYTLVDLGYEFPRYPVTEGETMDSFLRKRTEEGFRTVTVRNETRSYLNEPKSRCNGNRRSCLSFEWCGEGELRTPKYENRKSCFFLCLEFRFSEQNGEIQQEKVTRKIAQKKVCIIKHLYFWRRGGD
jgi:DNA polymerase III alpha subunit